MCESKFPVGLQILLFVPSNHIDRSLHTPPSVRLALPLPEEAAAYPIIQGASDVVRIERPRLGTLPGKL